MLNLGGLQELGIDTVEGLAYCADDQEFYIDMLREYVSEAKDRIDRLCSSFSSRDWKNYGIQAHSIKSTSRMIGAKNMSELARAMEMAAKDGMEEAILSGHDRFVAGYCELSEHIAARIR